jgi:hypothetical protein
MPRPVLLGYIRADVLRSADQVERVEAQLFDFADREEFSLGTVYVERGTTAAAFHSLMSELAHDDATWGLVLPALRHLTDREQQVLGGHDAVVQTRIVVANCPDPAKLAPGPLHVSGSGIPPQPYCAKIPEPRLPHAEAAGGLRTGTWPSTGR